MDENIAPPATLSARIAALNMNQVGKNPHGQPDQASQPSQGLVPYNGRPSAEAGRRKSTNGPIQTTRSTAARQVGNQPISARNDGILPPPTLNGTSPDTSSAHKPQPPPRLPPRRQSVQPSPALPPRRPSENLAARRDSIESTSSAISNVSSRSNLSNGTTLTSSNSRSPSFDASSRVKAPAYDPSSLPPLPPKRTPQEKEQAQPRVPLRPARSTSNIHSREHTPRPTQSAVPPLPVRRNDSSQSIDSRHGPPPPYSPAPPKRSALSFGMNEGTEKPPSLPSSRPIPGSHASHEGAADSPPPVVPIASRPTTAQLEASKQKATAGDTGSCLKCRDFSAVDYHASRFPRQSLPSTSLDWLAQNLTSQFSSLTDKARVIFTWLHHNVEYDVKAFFGGNIQPSTPQSTLSSGLAVCEGYAALFTALASKAGLESIVVGGHGKGYGFTTLKPGSPIPPYDPSGHAWNAVKIDEGEWKLLDPCWGAGTVNGAGQPYNKRFAPCFFTMDNVEFGLRHFPQNKAHFFRPDGRVPSWEEYVLGDASGEPPQIFSGAQDDHGLSETKFLPRYKKVNVSEPLGPVVRFQFEKICQHWDGVKAGKGKPYVFILTLKNAGGAGKDDFVPFETNGHFWWVDVPVGELGKRGDKIMLYAVTTVGGQDGRGMSVQEYRGVKGRKAMGFGGVASWELI
ncbi:MAG: hypothetical protein M4579_006898 [Chaenotheca gracillima]|nr:MAG: hypothetical protein M4579_006898 [Chaenotheca gracillima]